MLKRNNLLVATYGFANIIVFVILGAYGGIYESVHSLLFREFSYTISPYAPTSSLSVPVFLIFNITLFLFSLFLSIRLHNLKAKMGALTLSFTALAGIALIYYPIDPPYTKLTVQGVRHNIIAVLMSIYSVIAMNWFATSFKKAKNLKSLASHSVKISYFILIMSMLIGIFAFLYKPYLVGLLQKFAIGAFIYWIFITSVAILKSDRRIKYLKAN